MTALTVATPLAGARQHPAVPASLAWAIAVSLALHAALVAMTLGAQQRPGGESRDALPLRAVITVPDITASLETIPLSTPLTTAATRTEQLASLRLPDVAAVTAAAEAAPARRGSTGDGFGKAAAVPLRDRARLGEFYDRTLTEFPAEIDRPPRMDGAIVARYPLAALSASREETVVVWVVVNEQGYASQIEIAEGSDDFAEQVRAALRAARFKPAEDRLKPIRFPIALQFDFRIGAESPAGPVRTK